jgi:hypothetical protein
MCNAEIIDPDRNVPHSSFVQINQENIKTKKRQKRPLILITPSPDMLSIKNKYLSQRLNIAFGHLQRLELAELLAAERGQDGAQPLERRVQVVHAAALPLIRHHPLNNKIVRFYNKW